MAGPSTAFETSGGATWTSLTQEKTFLDALAALPGVTVDQAGTSVQSRPIYRVTIGTPNRAPLLITGLQHGNEPAGREAALQTARNLATATDQPTLDYLAAHTVVIVPTVNPDGMTANTRENSNGVNINRDHVTVATPEALAVQATITRVQPVMALDLHEHNLSAFAYNAETAPGDVTNIYPPIRAAVVDAVQNYIKPGIVPDGFTVGPYTSTDNSQLDAGSLRNAACLRHAVAVLCETHSGRPNLERVATHVAFVREAIRYHRINGAFVSGLSERSRLVKEAEAKNQSRAFDLSDATVTASVNPPATGYVLTTAQQTSLAPRLNALGIMVENGVAWAHQRSQTVIPYFLDTASPYKAATATRAFTATYPYRLEWWNGGQWRETVATDLDSGQVTTSLAPSDFGVSVDVTLSGTGTLTATSSPSLTASAALSGTGTLTAAPSVSATRTATLSGTGALTASTVLALSRSAGLSGAGTLAAVWAPALTVPAALSGTGTLSAASSGSTSQSVNVSLSGTGTLTATTSAAVTVPVSLSGTGSLIATSRPGLSRSAALSGAGTLAAVSVPGLTRTGALSGSGALTAAFAPGLVTSVALEGHGELSARVPSATEMMYRAADGTWHAVRVRTANGWTTSNLKLL